MSTGWGSKVGDMAMHAHECGLISLFITKNPSGYESYHGFVILLPRMNI
ncbi:hypothetical protein JMJ77_0010599 [Colletotrichum scovillei]|uniref:Uncharacterized protein n=1 Tax=Colletotrichum scovillei TaxID=1209932 RepID=A0A9P7UFY7_9PEZI|nr:hypothetical protein JMJ77_0010599 [Colletotrichum scovillei]KAG7059563.1 hypothetical protein JMJ78_0014854 [Colletotrichum scovillei]KAG7067010.1 hypothetical protein JMJ76_0008455 [Colletotrichum scovillei]